MNAKSFLAMTAIVIATAIPGHSENVNTGSERPQVNEARADVSIEQFGLWTGLSELARQRRIVIGVVGREKNLSVPIKINLKSATVAEALDALLKQAPAFTWRELDSGTYRVTDGSMVTGLADTTVSYAGAQATSRQEFWNKLSGVGAVEAWLSAHSCRRVDYFDGYEFHDFNGPMSIPPKTTSFGDLLDEVAGQSGVDFWGIEQRVEENQQCAVRIFIW